MSYTTKLVDFGNGISLNIECRYESFSYLSGTKNVRFTLFMENNSERIGYFSALGVCKIDFLSKSFALPSGFMLALGRTDLAERSVSAVRDTEYGEVAMADVTLSYTSGALGELSASAAVAVKLGKMYYAPELTLDLSRIELGQQIGFSGEMIAQGYSLTARIENESGQVLGMAQLYDGYAVMQTYPEWISTLPNSAHMSATVCVSGQYGDHPLPSEQKIPVTLYLDSVSAAPSFSVDVEYVSEYNAVNGIEYGVKNRSGCVIGVNDIVCSYGASLDGCWIVYKGVEYPMSALETGILTEAGQVPFTVRVRDSRGFIGQYSSALIVRDYAPADFSASVVRTDKKGVEMLGGDCITISIGLNQKYELDGRNEYVFYYTYAPVTDLDEIQRVDMYENTFGLDMLGLDRVTAYEVVVYCEDLLGSVTSRSFLLESERVELNIAKNRVSVGKYADEEYVFGSAWRIKCDSDIEFVDGDGRAISLSEQFNGGFLPIMYKECSAMSDVEIDAALSCDRNGVCMIVLDVKVDGLRYSKGTHSFLIMKNGMVHEL